MKSNNFFRVALSVFVSFVFVFAVTYAATTISTSISTGGTLTVNDTSTLTGAVTLGTDLTVTSGTRVGADASGGHITALADDSLFVEGQSEFDGTSWFDGSLRASSTLMATGAATLYSTLDVTSLATFLGGATTTILTLLNGETITNATDGTIVLNAATTSMTGGTFSNGFLSTASSTVVGNLTVTGTFSPTQTAATSFTVGGGFGDPGVTISAAGAISADGLATLLGGATTTILTLLNGEIISNGTDGVIQLGGVASTTSITLLNGETITNATDGEVQITATTLKLIGTASTSAIKVGDEPAAPTIEGMVFGYCSFGDVTSFTASTTKYADCTTVPAGALLAGDRVFVQATSSFDSMFVITAASTTGVSTINLRILNTGLDGAADPTLGGTSINFWAVR